MLETYQNGLFWKEKIPEKQIRLQDMHRSFYVVSEKSSRLCACSHPSVLRGGARP